MFAILGSGFGLYGYLPALVEGCAQRVLLPERYRARLLRRPELARLASSVQWEADDSSALDRARGVAFALPPTNQKELIRGCLARPNIEYLLLEKPLAPSPETAEVVLNELADSGKTFRVSYIFRSTGWGKHLLGVLPAMATQGPLSIRWTFMADHFARDLRNWKRFSSTGGGAIRFYGIHVIALLAEAGYQRVVSSLAFGASPEECETWIAVFAGSDLPDCEVLVDSKSADRTFQVELGSPSGVGRRRVCLANLSDPFDSENGSGEMDRRVPALTDACRSLWMRTESEYSWYGEAIELWRRVEALAQFATNR